MHCFFASQRPPHCVMRRRRGCSRKMRKLCYQGNSLRGIVNCSGVARKVQNILLDNTLSQACLITIFFYCNMKQKTVFTNNVGHLWFSIQKIIPTFERFYWTKGRSFTDVVEDLRPTAMAMVAKV